MIDWREIDTVLLDMDGTLLDLHFDSHFWLEHLPRRYVELHQLVEVLVVNQEQRQLDLEYLLVYLDQFEVER